VHGPTPSISQSRWAGHPRTPPAVRVPPGQRPTGPRASLAPPARVRGAARLPACIQLL